ncbi:hypothetical protein CRUP_016983, partial [Coryphaenoides rupestris]
GYHKSWISAEHHSFEENLVEGLARRGVMKRCGASGEAEEEEEEEEAVEEEKKGVEECVQPIDPLRQLITLFSQSALTEGRGDVPGKTGGTEEAKGKWKTKRCPSKCEEADAQQSALWELMGAYHEKLLLKCLCLLFHSKPGDDSLYMSYATIMAKSCQGEEEEDGNEEMKTFEEKEMEKQKLLYQQARLHERGAAEMVLQTISASKGDMDSMVASTLKLGISILNGGNATVQQRQNKAEGLGMAVDDGSGEKVMPDEELTFFSKRLVLCVGYVHRGDVPGKTGGTEEAKGKWKTKRCPSKNFYNMRLLALFVAFAINFILLFYKVSPFPTRGGGGEEQEEPKRSSAGATSHGEGLQDPLHQEGSDPEGSVFILEESSGYMEPSLCLLAITHTLVSFCCIIGYYCLKREKEIARRLEFDGVYVTDQPLEDDIKGQWDRMAVNTRSFPSNYWDKFVKRK